MMSFIKNLHKNSLNLSQILRLINNEASWEAKGKIVPINIIKKCHHEITLELGVDCSCLSYADLYEKMCLVTAVPDKEFIDIFENILLNALYDWGKVGGFIASGYNNINSPCPIVIPKHEWAFLEIDKKKNIAYCEDRKYRDIKFILSDQLEHLTSHELDKLNFLMNGKTELELNTEQAIEPKNIENIQKQTSNKQRKKLKPLQRETNNALLLLYELFNHYKVTYLDQLPANKGWGKIISGEFSSDHIKGIAETKTAITLTGDEKLTKGDFLEKYRKRFA